MKRELGGNLLKFAFFCLCTYGIVRVSIWSYFQTQAFFVPFDAGNGNAIISNALALIFQYGQNITLFLASIEKGRQLAYSNKIASTHGNVGHIAILEEEIAKSVVLSNLMYVLFAAFALVDAGTNLGQFFETTYKTASETFALSAVGMGIFMGVGIIVSVVVVFVEEFFMKAANSVLHAFNDVLESFGMKRIPSLDLFVDPDKIIATRLEERGRGGIKSPQPSQHLSKPFARQMEKGKSSAKSQPRQSFPTRGMPSTTPPAPRSVAQMPFNLEEGDDDEDEAPRFAREEPVYHPIGMNASGGGGMRSGKSRVLDN